MKMYLVEYDTWKYGDDFVINDIARHYDIVIDIPVGIENYCELLEKILEAVNNCTAIDDDIKNVLYVSDVSIETIEFEDCNTGEPLFRLESF